MNTALACVAAVFLDRLLGEPTRWHPLVGFGHLGNRVEALLYPGAGAEMASQRAAGVVAGCLLLVPLVWLAYALAALPGLGWEIGRASCRERV